MSTRKSSTVTGTPAEKSINWTKVPDEELATDIDDADSVGDAKAQEKRRRMRAARDAEIRRAEEARQEAERKRQAEEAEKRGRRRRRGVRGKQKQSRSGNGRPRRGSEPLLQRPESSSGQIWRPRRAEARRTPGVKKRSACGSCAKAKERCEWPEVEMSASRAGTSPRGGECKKQAKKADDEDDEDEIIVLSGRKTKRQGGGELLEEIIDRRWGELIQAVSSRMDVANGHLERIASAAQSNGRKMQRHYML
ncbi:hypothetical protein ID866_12816, partial [Astraeus odoratus]